MSTTSIPAARIGGHALPGIARDVLDPARTRAAALRAIASDLPAEADFVPLIDNAAVERLTGLVDRAESSEKRVVRGRAGPDHGASMAAALMKDACGTEQQSISIAR